MATSSDGWVKVGRCRISSYCPECNSPHGYQTYTGSRAVPWSTVAVDTSVIPLGSTVKIEGYMDTSNASQLSDTLEGELDDVMELYMDMTDLEYITSAGLRAMLAAYQELDEKDGRMVLQHVNDDIKEVLNLTGFSNFLEVEN